MTKREAAIVTLYTGFVCGPFSNAHQLAEILFGRPIFTHEFGNKEFSDEVKEKAKPLFVELEIE